jgi:hypothetical protein
MTGTGDLELLVALRHGELARQLRAELGRHNFDDVRRGDGYVLRVLHAAPLTVSALAGRLGMTKPATGRIADDLCRRGGSPIDVRALWLRGMFPQLRALLGPSRHT